MKKELKQNYCHVELFGKQIQNIERYIVFHQFEDDPWLDIRYDIVLDATDNVATRYLLNDACILAGKPLVSGSALRFEGQVCYISTYAYDRLQSK